MGVKRSHARPGGVAGRAWGRVLVLASGPLPRTAASHLPIHTILATSHTGLPCPFSFICLLESIAHTHRHARRWWRGYILTATAEGMTSPSPSVRPSTRARELSRRSRRPSWRAPPELLTGLLLLLQLATGKPFRL